MEQQIIRCQMCGKYLKRWVFKVYEHPDYCKQCWNSVEEE